MPDSVYAEKGVSNYFVNAGCSPTNYMGYGRMVTVDNSGVTFSDEVFCTGVTAGAAGTIPKQIYGI